MVNPRNFITEDTEVANRPMERLTSEGLRYNGMEKSIQMI